MSVKSIFLKIVIGIVVIALLLGFMWFLKQPRKEEAEEVVTVYSSDEEIMSIDITEGGESFTLVKTDGKWQVEGMEGAALIGNLPETLSLSLSHITSPMLISEDADDLSNFGLEEPSAEVTLNFADHSQTFLIGSESGDYYYFKKADDDKVYIVSYDTLYLIFGGKMSFLSKTAVSIDQSKIDRVSYRDVVIERDGDAWTEIKPYSIAADENTVTGRILPGVSGISALEVFAPGERAFSEYERVFIDCTDESVVLRLSKEDNGAVLMKVGNGDYVYSVSKSSLSFLDISGFEAASKYIAPISITEVASLELVSPEKTDVLTIEAPSSEAPVFYKNGAEADETNFRDFYQALMSLTFTGTGSASGDAEYRINFEKESGERVDISFIPYSEAEYAVRINGKTNFIIAKKPVRDVFSYINNIKTV